MNILFIGPQGSGKSTQANMLSEYLKIPFISFGHLLRQLAKQDTVQGQLLRNDMSRGKLVDDFIAAKVMQDRVSQDDCKSGFVSDGYARSLHQLSLFDPKFDAVIFLNISDEEVTNRLLRRAKTEGRQDDTPEAIKLRLDSYHKYTEPVLEKYRQQGVLKTIPGVGEVGEIQKTLREIVDQERKKEVNG